MPKMLGIWRRSDRDAASVRQPDEYIWHSGISADRIMSASNHGGVRDNLHIFFDVAGEVNAVTLLIGTNDLTAEGNTPQSVYLAYKNLLYQIKSEKPNVKVFGSTILDRDGALTENHQKVLEFNTLLQSDYASGLLPDNYICLIYTAKFL